MSETREAGALILSQLEMFNETVKLYATVIHPAVQDALVNLFIETAEDQNWIGGYAESEAELWLGLANWNAAESGEKVAPKASIDLVDLSDNDDFYIAALCGFSGASAGFKFFVDPRAYGGSNQWKKYVQSWAETTPKCVQHIKELGFRDLGNGEFCLPVQLDAKALADAYQNDDYDEALRPLQTAFDTIKSALPHFDQILNDAPSNG